jgi:hypothetical protein
MATWIIIGTHNPETSKPRDLDTEESDKSSRIRSRTWTGGEPLNLSAHTAGADLRQVMCL